MTPRQAKFKHATVFHDKHTEYTTSTACCRAKSGVPGGEYARQPEEPLPPTIPARKDLEDRLDQLPAPRGAACEGEAMLQRVNEGQDGTRGHLMYGSCPGLHATQSSHLAPPHVQGGHELASCGSSAGGYRFECWQRHKPDWFIAADARAAGDGVDGTSGGCASQKGARLGASATSVKRGEGRPSRRIALDCSARRFSKGR